MKSKSFRKKPKRKSFKKCIKNSNKKILRSPG